MKKRFNYTGRKRITLDRLSIKINTINHTAGSFDASIKLEEMGLPDHANVYVEAYHHTDLARFPFGTVGTMIQPDDRTISHLANYENLRFRILVVDETDTRGLVLAHADRIRPTGVYRKRSILPVDFRDLGRQVWKMDYSGDEPVLMLNVKIPNVHNLARTDPRFRLYIYPAVTRDIFTHISFIDRIDDIENPSQDWHLTWLNFAERFTEEDSLSQLILTDDEQSDPQDALSCIDNLVEKFCATQSKDWFKLLSLEEVG